MCQKPLAMPENPQQSLRLALFAFDFRKAYDGATKALYNITDRLEKNRTPFTVLSPSFDKEWPYSIGERKNLFSVPFPLYTDYRLTLVPKRVVFNYLDHFKPNLIHISTPCTLGHIAAAYAKARNLPIIGTYHSHTLKLIGDHYFSFTIPLAKYLFRKFYNAFDLLLVPTQTVMDHLKDSGIHIPMKIWGRGVETDFFNPAHRSSELRKKWGAQEHPVILYAGRLVKEKGLSKLVTAYHQIKKRHPEALWWIAGQGTLEKKLKKLLPDVRFLGHLSREKLRGVYASSDIFVCPSATETFGNAVVEAMASGLPVITTNEGGSAELVQRAYQNNVTIFPAGQSEVLAQKISLLIQDQALRQQLSQQSLAFAKQQQWSPLLDQIVLHYEMQVNPL